VVVKLWDLRRLVLPINYFIEKPFQNWTRVSADLLGTVQLHLDYGTPVAEIRAAFERVLTGSPLWDGRTSAVQVTDCTEQTMEIRLLMGARTAQDLWDLRCHVREELIRFVQHYRTQAVEPAKAR
jgi:small-conductance mechanosensitive channel